MGEVSWSVCGGTGDGVCGEMMVVIGAGGSWSETFVLCGEVGIEKRPRVLSDKVEAIEERMRLIAAVSSVDNYHHDPSLFFSCVGHLPKSHVFAAVADL